MSAAQVCQQCETPQARLYEHYSFTEFGVPVEPVNVWLCAKCARAKRREMKSSAMSEIPAEQISRHDLIAALDRFWAESGALEICRRCHQQGTGCCPPMCRYLSETGCQQKNVFCTGFVCSALLNAIAECDPEIGRAVGWVKKNVAAAEFRIYEMITRVPAVDREKARPLKLPGAYPNVTKLDGQQINTKLLALTEEVLSIRRNWNFAEKKSVKAAITQQSSITTK